MRGRNLDYCRYDGKGIRSTEEELRKIKEAVKVEDVLEAEIEVLEQSPC